MTDNKTFLHNVFEDIKLLSPKTIHYALAQATPGSGQEMPGQAHRGVRILVICDQPLSADELQQADKILLACKLDLSNKTIVTVRDFMQGGIPVSKADYLFLFGTGPSELGFNFDLPVNRMVRLNGACWIKALPVKTLIKSQEAKSDLWKNGLQPHFQDS